MKLKIRYENEFQTIELDAKATEEMWVTLSIETDGAVTQEEKEQLIQDKWDEQFNKPEYNVYHRETRHIDPTPKKKRMDGKAGYICAEPDDKSFDIIWLLYQKYAGCGYTKTNTHIYEDSCGKEHTKVHTKWTQKGRLFIYSLLKADGIVPQIEMEE